MIGVACRAAPPSYFPSPAVAEGALFLLKIADMMGMHSASKGQREVVRQLVHSVVLRDMGTFNAERFKDWYKQTDAKFRKVALTLSFRIHDREVDFAVKEVRTGRTVFHFTSATRVRFEDRDVVIPVEAAASTTW